MKDQNKLIIGVVAIIAVVYFLFFKQKEGFNNVREGIDTQELLWYLTNILPLKHGGRMDHPEARKAMEMIDYISRIKDPRLGLSISQEDIRIFKNNAAKLEEKYSRFLPSMFQALEKRIMEQAVEKPGVKTMLPGENQASGMEGETLKFICPVRSGFIMYGSKDRQLRYNIPDGTTVLTINNDTMRGDPAPGMRKSWSVKYIC